MPIQYSGVLDEYRTVRSKAGLFDVSHMGRITVSGPGSVGFLQYVTTNDVSKISVRSSQYSMVCNPNGESSVQWRDADGNLRIGSATQNSGDASMMWIAPGNKAQIRVLTDKEGTAKFLSGN